MRTRLTACVDIFQIQNMPNFHKDMKMLCKIISNTAKVAADPPAESANNVTEEEPIIPTQEQLEMQRGLRSLVRNSRHDLKMDDHILSSAEWIGPDSVRTAFMREMGLLKTRLPDDQGVPAPMYNILLYGPEGTGKTAIVYSFAKWAGWTFYDVDLSAILDDKVGQNEKYASAVKLDALLIDLGLFRFYVRRLRHMHRPSSTSTTLTDYSLPVPQARRAMS